MPLFGSIPADRNVEVDPVWVQPGAPSAPDSGELWWDTDDPAPSMPGQELAYNQITASATITATSSATGQLVIEGTSLVYDGSPVMVEAYAQLGAPALQGHWLVGTLWDQNTDLGGIWQVGLTANSGSTLYGLRRLVPTPGTHNYRVKAWVTSGSGTVYANTGAAQYAPAFIRVTRV